MRALLILLTWSAFAAEFTFGQQVPRLALNRATLPASARNLRLDRVSSGALMLLNENDNLVAPSAEILAGGIAREASAPVVLDLRIGPNIRLGNDPPQLPPTMRAQAEPHIARSLVNPDYLVAAVQEGRFASEGGAVDVGYSASHDGGMSWSRVLLPNLTQASGGPFYRATDPVVAFGSGNNVYVSTDAATDTAFKNGVIAVSRSADAGATFGAPVVAYHPPDNNNFPDKEWIAVNTFAGTPAAGRLLVTFTLFSNTQQNVNPIVRTYSDNGGATWSPIANVTGAGSSVQGSQPVYLPNGTCVIVYWNFGRGDGMGERLEAVISSDGGSSFGAPRLIAKASEWNEPAIRSGGFLPSAAVDRNTGAIYVVYQTVLNGSPRIAFTKSTNGGVTWSAPIAISDNPSGLGVFNPAINVAPGGRTVTAAFYDHRNNPGSKTLVDLYLAQSFDGGATWQPNIRLSSVSTDAALAPLTSEGYMLGDYLGIAESSLPTIPAVPIWVDTRTGNPDPFITRAGIAPYPDLATAWEAAHTSVARTPPALDQTDGSDPDRDGEDNQAENIAQTNATDYRSVSRSGKDLNISTRLHVETGDGVGIAGFIISGSASKNVLIRALGPSLASFNVPDLLLDPALELYDAAHNLIATNDNWRNGQTGTIPSGFAPADDREAVIYRALPPGAYTAIVRGAGDTSGSALVEVYDFSPTSSSLLGNLSTRAKVETGNFVPIGGLIVGGGAGANGDGSSHVLVRGIGPELTSAGVANALLDPVVELYDANGTQIAVNDNWRDQQQAAISATGLAPKDDRESAILVTLVRGNWTAILRGKNNSVGVGLIEAYRVQ